MLSQRLTKISEMLEVCDSVADIGSDHGLLPLELLKNGKINFAVLCDLRENPLNQARRHFQEAHLSHKAHFFQTDGLKNVEINFKNVIIAGMGFETILHILNNSLADFKKMDQIILQSNTKVYHIRKFMFEQHFELLDERFVEERHHGYTILKYRYNPIQQILDEPQIYYGLFLLSPISGSYRNYLEKELKRLEDLSHTKNDKILKRKEILINLLSSK